MTIDEKYARWEYLHDMAEESYLTDEEYAEFEELCELFDMI